MSCRTGVLFATVAAMLRTEEASLRIRGKRKREALRMWQLNTKEHLEKKETILLLSS